jgi:ADP-dependent NAD(P)H-hydrate dehydratase / NAD(P)H-hydrate epimerase
MPQETRNSPELWLEHFPRLRPEYNKYDRGYVVIGGGGISSTGAARISARCALRSGAGLVSVACDAESLPIYAASMQAVMTKLINNTQEFAKLIEDRKVTAVALGSGAGVTEKTKEFVLVTLAKKKSMVIDADAISVFSDNPHLLFSSIKSPCTLTPHEGEFKRLFGELVSKDGTREARTQQAAKLSGAVVILKGTNTVIAAPDGRVVVNYDAPSYLASAGTGDALAGICAGLLAQGMPFFEAGCAGVWLHTQAALKFGVGLIAEDIADLLPTVLKKIHSLRQ